MTSSLSNTSRIGSHISFVYGARTPGVLNTPASTSCVTMSHGTPTVRAMAECPAGVTVRFNRGCEALLRGANVSIFILRGRTLLTHLRLIHPSSYRINFYSLAPRIAPAHLHHLVRDSSYSLAHLQSHLHLIPLTEPFLYRTKLSAKRSNPFPPFPRRE
jgi:hypothetical protein